MDIEAWLRELGLERYAQAFRDNEIDARSLPHLTGDDLKRAGGDGHRSPAAPAPGDRGALTAA